MRHPRWRPTVRWMLAAVAVVGLDLALIREAYLADEREPCTSNLSFPALAFVPPLSLLGVAALSAGAGVVRRGWASPFATGYLLLGGLATLAVCLDLAAGTHQLARLPDLVKGLLDPALAPGAPETRLTAPRESVLDGWAGDLLLVAVYVLPQFTLAAVGGGLARRHGLTIAVRGGRRPGERTPSSTATVHEPAGPS